MSSTKFRKVTLESVLNDQLVYQTPFTSAGQVLTVLRTLRGVKESFKSSYGKAMMIDGAISAVKEYAKENLSDAELEVVDE